MVTTCVPESTTATMTTTTATEVNSTAFGVRGGSGGNTTGLSVCKPGALLPMASDRLNAIIIGDSVSIGYTPHVADALQDQVFVQHSPADVSDGGAEETAYGLQCIENFLRGSDGSAIVPDLLYFNWGLHNLNTDPASNVPGQSGTVEEYLPSLVNITARIMDWATNDNSGRTAILFGLTSPEMCDVELDDEVQSLNQQALELMSEVGIPTVDLHAAVVDACGLSPQASCLGEEGGGCPEFRACSGFGNTGDARKNPVQIAEGY